MKYVIWFGPEHGSGLMGAGKRYDDGGPVGTGVFGPLQDAKIYNPADAYRRAVELLNCSNTYRSIEVLPASINLVHDLYGKIP